MGTPRKNPTVQPPRQSPYMGVANDRETGYGMIAPGSHPEFDKDTPLDAMVRGAKQVASNVGDFLNTHFGTKHTPKPVTNTQPDQPGKQ